MNKIKAVIKTINDKMDNYMLVDRKLYQKRFLAVLIMAAIIGTTIGIFLGMWTSTNIPFMIQGVK